MDSLTILYLTGKSVTKEHYLSKHNVFANITQCAALIIVYPTVKKIIVRQEHQLALQKVQQFIDRAVTKRFATFDTTLELQAINDVLKKSLKAKKIVKKWLDDPKRK